MTDWFKARLLGRMRVSTIVLIVAFVALFWVNQTFQPEPPAPAPAVVPPGFVPDPAYTWVPRTNVRRPKEPTYTTTTTPPTTTTTTTTSPTTTTPTTPTTSTTVVDPDGFGPLPPTTQTLTPSPSTPPPPGQLPLPTPTSTPAP